jgi:hypothetical protein
MTVQILHVHVTHNLRQQTQLIADFVTAADADGHGSQLAVHDAMKNVIE